MKIIQYGVAGDGPFPFDMLRFDQSWPADQAEVPKLEQLSAREIQLCTHNRHSPDLGRWQSMGWRVTEIQNY